MRSIKNARLTDSDIPGLRRRIITKVTTAAQEADRFSVGIETIRRAVRGETFRHIRDYLDDPDPSIAGHAEHATRHPLDGPNSDAVYDSIQRVLDGQDADLEANHAVDFFLEKRKKEGE